MNESRLARIRAYFEQLTPAAVQRIGEIYAPDAYFKDPFNEVRGAAAIGRIFAHMFEQVEAPRFFVREAVCADDTAFLTWDFTFRRRGRPQSIHGATLLTLAADGRIASHRDYWDAAGELYEKLPVLGAVLRWLRRRISVHDL
ncbi:MAG TPA: nuclear transport factor 2 family protein [Burkholderiaceae bacterium]|jgi:ketosteroid isomerase-like protein|nr:nuclear transport factor 2 family protein [Burkholderiaceae bacterium]